jgi:hypothetical protein
MLLQLTTQAKADPKDTPESIVHATVSKMENLERRILELQYQQPRQLSAKQRRR